MSEITAMRMHTDHRRETRSLIRADGKEHEELPSVRHQVELTPVLGLREAFDWQRNGLGLRRRVLGVHVQAKHLLVAIEVEGAAVSGPERVRTAVTRQLMANPGARDRLEPDLVATGLVGRIRHPSAVR